MVAWVQRIPEFIMKDLQIETLSKGQSFNIVEALKLGATDLSLNLILIN